MNKQLARITKAKTEIQEGSIFNFWVYVDYEDLGSQGIGGIALDEYSEEKKTRVGTTYGCEMLRQLLIVLGIDDLSEARGKLIWVLGEGKGLSFKPKGIKQLELDGGKEMIFEDIAKEFIK